jgi:hypothetical protein
MKMMEFIKIATGVSALIFAIGLCFAVTVTYFSPLGILLFWSAFCGIIVAACVTIN